MNDLENLDQRARRAATDVRSRASVRPRPAFEASDASLMPAPARLDDRRPRRTLLAAAAVVLLVLAGGLAFVARHQGGDGKGPADTTTSTELPRPFVATTLPKGLALSGAVDGSSGNGQNTNPFGPFGVYGAKVDRPELGVGVLPVDDGGDLKDAKRVEVDGRTVLTLDDVGLGKRVVIVRQGRRFVFAMSPSLDRSVLADVAEGTRIVGNRAVVADSLLPDGFRLLAEQPEPFPPGGVMTIRQGAVDGVAATTYMDRAAFGKGSSTNPDDLAVMGVISSAGDSARMQAARLWADDVTEVSVRGHQALLTSAPTPVASATDPVARLVTWVERPGELLQVWGWSVSADDLLRAAESVRPVEANEWADMVERTNLGEYGDGAGIDASTEVGRGRFADGMAWRLATVENGSTDGPNPKKILTPLLVVALGGNSDTSAGSSGSDDPAAVFRSNVTLDQGGRHFAAGFVNPSVEAVELQRSDGSVIERAQMVEGGGQRAWVAELTADPTVIVALAADGRELDRVTFSNLAGNESPEVSEGPATTVADGGAGASPQTTVLTPAPLALPGN